MTVGEVKNLLRIYYDIPQMIAEEWAAIRNCEAEKYQISLPSVNLTGLPGGKGLPGDRTASMALADQTRYYDDEIKRCSRRIAELRGAKSWLGVALGKLDPTDRYILELRYMGDQRNRKYRRRPEWKEIAGRVELSEGRVRERARVSLLQLAMQADQVVFPGMAR